MKLRFTRRWNDGALVYSGAWLRYTYNLWPVWDNDPMKYLRKALR